MTFGTDAEEPRPDTDEERASSPASDAPTDPATTEAAPDGPSTPPATPPEPEPEPQLWQPEPTASDPVPEPAPEPAPPPVPAPPPEPQPIPEPIPEPVPPAPEPIPPVPDPTPPAPPAPEPVPPVPEPMTPLPSTEPAPPRVVYEPPPLPVVESAPPPAAAPAAPTYEPSPAPTPAPPTYEPTPPPAAPPTYEPVPPPAAPPTYEPTPPPATPPAAPPTYEPAPPPAAPPAEPTPAPAPPSVPPGYTPTLPPRVEPTPAPPPVAPTPIPPPAAPTPLPIPEAGPAPGDLFQGFTVIVAEDPDAWAAQVADRVGARVISSAFTAEQVLTHRAEVAEQKRMRERLKEAERITNLLAAAPGAPSAPVTPSAFGTSSSPGQEAADAATRSAIERVRQLAAALDDARQLEATARARVDQAVSESDAAARIQSSLATAPNQLREASAKALHAADQARGLKDSLGPRPVYDPETHQRVTEAGEDAEDAVDHYDFLRRRVPSLLAVALGLALVAISQSRSIQKWALYVIVIVLLVAVGFMFRRLFAVRSKRVTAQQGLATALTSAGVERADQLEQRKIELEAWERRSGEASAADAAWAEASRQWQDLAGPEAQPDQVERLIEDLQRAQQVTERLSTDRTAHLVAGQDVQRREEEWARLMHELGLDAPAADPQRAISQLSSRLSAGAAASGYAAGTGAPSGDRDRLQAELSAALEGFTLAELRYSVQRLGPDHPVDDRPILLADPTRGLPTDRKRTLLSEFERLSKLSPVVLVTADPEVQAWAASR